MGTPDAGDVAPDATLDDGIVAFVREATGAASVAPADVVQTLWSGFGRIQRVRLTGATDPSAILKLVDVGADASHPRGWNTDASRRRKLASYEIERRWYADFARRCDDRCRVPAALGARDVGRLRCLLLEDLDASYPSRRTPPSLEGCAACLRWLAAFHARFLGDEGVGLWPTGCYWHLGTRADELAAMADSPLRRAAGALDGALEGARHRTLLHGDAKLANFCFDAAGTRVAAVDFQYVGRGPGVRDVVYLLGGCLDGAACERHETHLLDLYFDALSGALAREGRAAIAAAVESEWRDLYAIAWADFLRFLLGWMPEHPKVTRHARGLAEAALARLAADGPHDTRG